MATHNGKVEPWNQSSSAMRYTSVVDNGFVLLNKSGIQWSFSNENPTQAYSTQIKDKTIEKPLLGLNGFLISPSLLGTTETVFGAIRRMKRSTKRNKACDLDGFAADVHIKRDKNGSMFCG